MNAPEEDPSLRHYVEQKTGFATLTQLGDLQTDVKAILTIVKGEIDGATGLFKPGLVSRLGKLESIYSRIEKAVYAIVALLGGNLLITAADFFYKHLGVK